MNNELSLLEDNTKNKIRTLYLEGKNFKQIQEELNLNPGTWDNYFYLDKNGFRSFILDIKKQRFILNAEKVSDEIMSLKTDNNAKLLTIKQKEAEFLRETLGRETYSKRAETFGINLTKTEPLDDEQRAKIDNLIKPLHCEVNRDDKDHKVVECVEYVVDNIPKPVV